jgi:hypothetical protein
MIEKGEIAMFFWEHRDGNIEMAEGLVRYVHPSGFLVVTTDLVADISHYIKDKSGNVFLRVPLDNIIAVKAGHPRPVWLAEYES